MGVSGKRAQAPLFAPSERVESARLALSSLSLEHLEAMSPWLEAALAPEWHLDDLRRLAEAGGCILIMDSEGEAIGAAAALLASPVERAACIPFLAIEPGRRFRGLGGEAGLALERHLHDRFAVERTFAPVPDGRGLAVYFWLRLGYRPLLLSQAPAPPLGLTSERRSGIWLMRDGSEP